MLYPAPLRDLLMRLTLSGLFRARWTNQIYFERQDIQRDNHAPRTSAVDVDSRLVWLASVGAGNKAVHLTRHRGLLR